MTQHVSPPLVLIPEGAPFNEDQRAWLSGYFAALLGPAIEGATALAAGEGPATGPKLADNDDAPWHDPSMPLGDRMDLAKDRSNPQKLMAAMAQQDCGQCGYNCADYANAIFLKSEERLNLCQPGGKETMRMLKKLDEEFGAGGGAAPAKADGADAPAKEVELGPLGYCRENPVYATFLSRCRLNDPGGEKETWHIDIDLRDTPIEYVVGDSLGLFPANAPALVDAVIAELGSRPERIIGGRTLRDALLTDYALGAASWRAREWLGWNATLAEGAPADFVVYARDPLLDLTVLHEPSYVVLRGRAVVAA